MRVNFCLILGLLACLLAACGGEVYERAYTAAGQGLAERDLRPDAQFSTRDDLNVVVKLNPHDGSVDVTALFIDPNGDPFQEITQAASDQTGTVIFGLDFEARGDQNDEWLRGRYQVDILIDGDRADTLYFRVD